MRQSLFKILALVLAVGVIAFVVQASRQQARELDAGAARASASAAAAAAAASAKDAGVVDTPPPEGSKPRYGVIGPATKADPHTVRRAVESLAPAPSSSQVAP